MKNTAIQKLDETTEARRVLVIKQELEARSWKAHYEKMYYTLESEKLNPAYDAWLEKAKADFQLAQDKKLEEIKAALQPAPEAVTV